MLAATEYVKTEIGDFQPTIGIVLGSGLGFFADERVRKHVNVPYKYIPEFPRSTVQGHKGNLVFGHVGSHAVACMQGRFHYYEGYAMSEVVKPIRVMAELGVKRLIITNAAGGINENFQEGTLMLITDHINLMGSNPLMGANDDSVGVRFPDMTAAYDEKFRAGAASVADALNIKVDKGVYLATTGPSFETPAEIRAFKALGADAVGMSTVPEVIAARHAGLRVCGISCITNKAAGLSGKLLSHDDVEATASRIKGQFADLLEYLVPAVNEM
jgi:purine-nucleoside phosphorylase